MSVKVFASAAQLNLTDMKIPETVAFADDLHSSGNLKAPITAGLFRMGRGKALPYTYEFDEYKMVLEGEMTVTDADGTIYELRAGDLIFFSKGSVVKFSSNSSGLVFYCAQR